MVIDMTVIPCWYVARRACYALLMRIVINFGTSFISKNRLSTAPRNKEEAFRSRSNFRSFEYTFA